MFSEYLNVDKVIWLENGLVGYCTHGHVDVVMSFIRPGEVVVLWTENPEDSQYDKKSIETLREIFLDRDVIGLEGSIELSYVGGIIDCMTQQQPSGKKY